MNQMSINIGKLATMVIRANEVRMASSVIGWHEGDDKMYRLSVRQAAEEATGPSDKSLSALVAMLIQPLFLNEALQWADHVIEQSDDVKERNNVHKVYVMHMHAVSRPSQRNSLRGIAIGMVLANWTFITSDGLPSDQTAECIGVAQRHMTSLEFEPGEYVLSLSYTELTGHLQQPIVAL